MRNKAKKRIEGFTDGYKSFITKGNIIDMAIGVVIGTAFTAIVNSLVKDIITPLLSILTKNAKFSDLTYKINDVEVAYGNFLEAIINFFLISLTVYIVVFWIIRRNKTLNELKKKELEAEEKKKLEESKKEEEKKNEVINEEVLLLRSIKDLLERIEGNEEKI